MTESIRGVYERTPGSNEWWIRYTVDGVKRREKVGLRSNAIKLLAKRLTAKLQNIKLPELGRNAVSFGQLLDDAIEHSSAANGYRTTHELKLKIAIIRPEWGRRRADTITKQEIVRWLQKEKSDREWSTATTNRYQACFSLVFRVGMDNEKIITNPASRIKRKAEDNQKTRYLLLEEETKLRALLAKKFPSYLPAFLISIHTGMRASEQWRVRWEDVDFSHKTLTVRKQKNGTGERHIPLNSIALSAFQSLQHSSRNPRDPVFLNSEKTPMKAHRDWFDPTVEAAAIEDYTWHINRHTFGSRLAMAGVPITTIAKLLGHRTIQMTMRYAHLSPDHNQSAVDKMADAFGAWYTKADTGQIEKL